MLEHEKLLPFIKLSFFICQKVFILDNTQDYFFKY